MKKKDHKRGFTLIELLIVIAIVGLLAAIVLISLSSARNKAKDVAYVSYMAQMYRLVSDAVAGDYMTGYAENGTVGCLGVYTTTPITGCSDDPVLFAALGQLSEVPNPGTVSPYINNEGVFLVNPSLTASGYFRIYAGVGTDMITVNRICNLAGWGIEDGRCYIDVKK